MMVRAMLCVLAVSLVGIAYSEEAAPHNGGVTGTTTLPSTDVCGKRGGRIKRVVGGSDADPGIFPWMAALGYTSSRFSNILWKCAGSLVTDRHVVTAAQCVGSTDDLAVVRMGIRDLNDTIEDNGGTPTDYEVDSWIQYPGYNVAEKVNDIAIIRLKNKVTFSHLIQPICLPTLGDFRTKNFTGFEAYIAGWGVSTIEYTGGAHSTRLQQAQILIWGETECKTAYDTLKKGIIDHRMVCAADDGKDTCQGDSGSPLMIPYGPDSNYYLYGVASFGRSCADPNYPGVYTRVSEFTDWILQNLK